MFTLRRDADRRHSQAGGREVWQTFFARDHPDPFVDRFGAMLGLDEMRLPPGDGFASHSGDEAEILTYVHAGALAQEDSAGSSNVIHAGEFQRMTTGRRVRHKETNASSTEWAHVFRICLRPSEVGFDLARHQRRFTAAQRRNVLCVVASRDGRKGSLRIHQDALIFSSILDPGHHTVHELVPGRTAWLHILHGQAALDGMVLAAGDGVGVTDEPSVSLTVQEDAEVLLIDLGSTF